MNNIFFLVVPFFALVVTGYAAARWRILDAPGVLGINRFVYFFALPALLFNKMAETDFPRLVSESAFVLAHLVAGLVVFALMWGTAKVLFKAGRNTLAVMALAGCYGNIGFLGIPLLVSVLGGEAAAPLSLMLLIDVAFFIPLRSFRRHLYECVGGFQRGAPCGGEKSADHRHRRWYAVFRRGVWFAE